ncbi:MAG: hypothetical protein IPK23_10450 [Rhizobiales bacterium]|nr:hypothetical protein [Hyphomicrobiales bacterium]
MITRIVAALCFLFLLSYPLSAEPFIDPKPERVCSIVPVPEGETSISPRRLLEYYFFSGGITDDAVNYKERISDEKRFDILLDPVTLCKAEDGCTDGTRAQLQKNRDDLALFLNRPRSPPSANESGFRMEPPGSGWTGQSLKNFFTGMPNSGRIVCIVRKKPVETPPQRNEASEKIQKFASKFLVRKSINELKLSGKQIESAGYATISLNTDYINRTSIFSNEMVVGAPMGKLPFGYDSELLGFVTHKSASGTGVSPKKRIGNAGVGLMAESTFAVGRYYQQLQFFTHYVNSYVTDTDVLIGQVNFLPTFPFPGMTALHPIGDTSFLFTLRPRLTFLYGNAINAGQNLLFVAQDDFVRGGGRIEIWLYSTLDLLKNFSLNTSYEHHEVFRGPLERVARFETTLAYALGEQKNWSLNLSYANGRDLNTLEREKVLMLGLGYRQ